MIQKHITQQIQQEIYEEDYIDQILADAINISEQDLLIDPLDEFCLLDDNQYIQAQNQMSDQMNQAEKEYQYQINQNLRRQHILRKQLTSDGQPTLKMQLFPWNYDQEKALMDSKKKKLSQFSNKDMVNLIKTLEKFMIQLKYSPQQLSYLNSFNTYQQDTQHLDQETKNMFQKFKRDIEKVTTTFVSIYDKKLKNDAFEYNKKFCALNEMKAILDDKEFQYQLQKAKPGTKELLNCMIMDATQNRLTNLIFKRSQILRVGNNTFGLKASHMLNELKLAYQKLVKIQMIQEKKSNKHKISFFNIFKKDTPMDVYNRNQQQTNRIKFGPAVEKFRKVIVNHFLSVSLEELETFDFDRMSLVQMLHLSKFKASLVNLFDEQKEYQKFSIYNNIGRRYELCAKNVFHNEYLIDFVKLRPRFGEYFRIKTMDFYRGNHCIEDNIIQFKVDEDKFKKLEQIFDSQLGKNDFFRVAKDQKLTNKNRKDQDMNGFIEFFEDARLLHPHKSADPSLILINDGIYCLANRNISFEQSMAVKNYIIRVKDNYSKRIQEVVIDNCQFTDETLANIFEAIESHKFQAIELNQPEIMYHELKSIVLSNISFGEKSRVKLKELYQELLELKFNNLRLSYKQEKIMMNNIFYDLVDNGLYLMKLSVTNIDIGSKQQVDLLCQVLNSKAYLQYIDISSCHLGPQHLKKITKQFLNMIKQLRDVNISYNRLDFSDESSQLYKDSEAFMENLDLLFKHGVILNHFNASGLNFTADKIKQLCQSVSQNNMLMSIHLNDNNISLNPTLMLDILDIFGIQLSDMPPERINHDEYQPHRHFDPLQKTDVKFDFRKNIQKYMLLRNESLSKDGLSALQAYQKMNGRTDYTNKLNKERRRLKNRIIMAKELKKVQQMKQLIKLKNYQSPHQNTLQSLDYFTLTRILNHPELIFNQNPIYDTDPQFRFFRKDSQQHWKLSKADECLICDRHAFTAIFYERGTLAANVGLTEIDDPEMLKLLKYDYSRNKIELRNSSPYIFGTVVNKGPNQKHFERRLKMLRTPIFGLLSVCQQEDFCSQQEIIEQIKDGVQMFLKIDDHIEKINASRFMKGWQRILKDQILDNQLTDVRAVNFPNLKVTTIEKQDWFTFAAFLPAGYHQILIYDPLLERAFCKDMVLKQNERDFVYPEYPVPTSNLKQKVVQNMWRKFIENKPADYPKILANEENVAGFQIESYIKNKEDQLDVKQFLIDNMETLLAYQKILMIQSNKFPQISWDSVNDSFVRVQKNPEFDNSKKIVRSKIELCFISATSEDETLGLRSAMQRAELLNFLVRMAKTMVYQNYSTRDPISTHLPEFFKTYLEPELNESTVYSHRIAIRKNKRLNELLFDNHKGLVQIYDYVIKQGATNPRDPYKGKCSRFATEKYFKLFTEPGEMVLNQRMIHECFIFSQMTIKNETKFMNKYSYLEFVEFQEMVCRIAIRGNAQHEPIDWKVFVLLDLMWEKQYKLGLWTKENMPLHKLNQTVYF